MRAQATDLLHLDHARRGEMYIACADWNFAWTPQELETVRLLRKQGAKIWTVAKAVGRPDYEVAVLIMDLEEEGRSDKSMTAERKPAPKKIRRQEDGKSTKY